MAGGLPQIGLQAILDDANFRAGFSNYTRSIDSMIAKTGIASSSLGGQFATLGSAVLGFGAKAALLAAGGVAALGAGMVGLGIVSTKTAISFESAWAGVTKTTDGLADSMGKLTPLGAQIQQGFRDLAKTTPIPVETLLHIGELGGQFGIANDALLGFTKTVAQMGVSTNLSVEEAATAFAQLSNIMGTPQSQFQNMGNAIVALGNNFATTEKDITEFAQRIAGAGKIAGLTEGDIFGIGAAFSSVGVEAEAGGTAVQKTLIDINKAVVDGGDQLKVYAETAGVSADEFKQKWKTDAGGAFADFVKGLGKQGDNAITTLEKLGLTDQRLIRGFLSVANAGDLMGNAMNLANNEFDHGNALQVEAAKRFATTQSQLLILKNQMRDLGITIGQAILPALNAFLGMLTSSVLPVLQDFAKYIAAVIEDGDFMNDWLSHLPGFLQPVAEGVGRVIAAFQQLLAGNFGGALQALGIPQNVIDGILTFAQVLGQFITNQLIPFVKQHLPELKGALIGIGAVLAGAAIWAGILAIAGAIAALANPITLIIGLAALLGAAWMGNWGNIQGIVGSVIAFVQNAVGNFVAVLQGFWQQNGAAIMTFFVSAWQTMQKIVSAVVAALAPAVQSFMSGLQTTFAAFQPIIQRFSELWQALGPLFQVVAQIVGAVLMVLLGVVVGVFSGIINALNPLFTTIANVFSSIVQIITGVIQFLTAALQYVVALFTNNADLVQTADANLSAGLLNIWNGLVSGIVSLVTGLVQTVWALVSGFVDGIIGFFTNLYNQLVGHSIIPDLVNAGITLFTTLVNTVIALVSGFVATVVAIFTGFANIVKAILAGLQAFWQATWAAIAAVTTAAWALIQNIVNVGVTAVRTFIEIGMALIQTIWQTVWGVIAAVVTGKWGEIGGIVQAGIDKAKSIIEIGINAAKAIWDSVWGGFVGTVAGAASSIIGKLEGLLSSVRSIVGNILSEAAKVGSGIISGITGNSGTGSKAPAQGAAKQATGVVSSWKKQMGIFSPSRVMASIGENMNLGLVRGMTRTGSMVNSQIRAMVNGIVSTAQRTRVNVANGGIATGSNVTNSVNNTVNLTINPTYEQYQSPASVYYDATAALAAARL
jgi:TP901 family phage tail tape measure protein